jgi:hypothetical protein
MEAKIEALGLSTTLRELPPAERTLDADERSAADKKASG